MNKKQEKLNMILELSSLINSTILYDKNLLILTKINSTYIYAHPYTCDNDLNIDNNIIFLSYKYNNTIYKYYTNTIK